MFNNLFKRKQEKITYQLVEAQLDEEHFRQGVRITSGKYSGLVFTTRPKVELKEIDGQHHLNFGYNIEYKPPTIQAVDHAEFKIIVGDILVELIEKDMHETGTSDSKHSD
jgi:hypothetical protein